MPGSMPIDGALAHAELSAQFRKRHLGPDLPGQETHQVHNLPWLPYSADFQNILEDEHNIGNM